MGATKHSRVSLGFRPYHPGPTRRCYNPPAFQEATKSHLPPFQKSLPRIHGSRQEGFGRLHSFCKRPGSSTSMIVGGRVRDQTHQLWELSLSFSKVKCHLRPPRFRGKLPSHTTTCDLSGGPLQSKMIFQDLPCQVPSGRVMLNSHTTLVESETSSTYFQVTVTCIAQISAMLTTIKQNLKKGMLKQRTVSWLYLHVSSQSNTWSPLLTPEKMVGHYPKKSGS